MKIENCVNVDMLKDIIKASYVERDNIKRFPAISGHTGLGKTEIIQQVAGELEIDCRIVALHCMDPAEFLGLPDKENGKMSYLAPDWYPMEGDGTKGILFFDEVNRIERQMQAPLHNFLLNKTIGSHKLNKDWIIVAACNPSESDGVQYDVNEWDAALEGKFRFFSFTPNAEVTSEYLISKHGHNPINEYLAGDPSALSYEGKKGTPRDFDSLICTLKATARYRSKDKKDDDITSLLNTEITTMAAGDIGMDLATAFSSFMTLRSYCTPDMVLHGEWSECESGLEQAKAEGRIDVQTAIMRTVSDSFLTSDKDPKVKNVLRFMETLGPEKSFTCLQLMTTKQTNSNDPKHHKRLASLIKLAKKSASPMIDWAKQVKGLMDADDETKGKATKKAKKGNSK